MLTGGGKAGVQTCDANIDGGLWTLVRHTNSGWHPANDALSGTDKYGRPDGPLAGDAWSIPFVNEPYDEFLFATGDCSKWMVVGKTWSE